MLENLVKIGGGLLIVLGIAHGAHVGRVADVEPYLWAASCFLVAQGVLTLVLLRRSA